MTPATARALRFFLLGAGVALLLVNLSGMMEWTPKVIAPRDMNIVIIVLIIASSALRKRSNESASKQ